MLLHFNASIRLQYNPCIHRRERTQGFLKGNAFICWNIFKCRFVSHSPIKQQQSKRLADLLLFTTGNFLEERKYFLWIVSPGIFYSYLSSNVRRFNTALQQYSATENIIQMQDRQSNQSNYLRPGLFFFGNLITTNKEIDKDQHNRKTKTQKHNPLLAEWLRSQNCLPWKCIFAHFCQVLFVTPSVP